MGCRLSRLSLLSDLEKLRILHERESLTESNQRKVLYSSVFSLGGYVCLSLPVFPITSRDFPSMTQGVENQRGGR